jgi:uncharacterized protein (DUF58 family)
MAVSGPPPPVGIVAASSRLVAYAAVGAASLIGALLAGRPALVAFGAPMVLLALVGVCLYRAPELVRSRARLVPEQSLAGDQLTLEVEVALSSVPARVDLVASVTGPVTVVGRRTDRAAWALSPGAPAAVRVELASRDWGRVAANAATIRADGPLGLVHRTWTVSLDAVARVLPRPERLRALLDPPPRAAAGSHASPARGGGLDFAELRALVPGDRLSEVNWRASARRPLPQQGLLVNARHPERTGDVVLLLDTAADDADERAPWLPRAARAAWALSQAHLQAHDRVGLVTFGGSTSWITAQGGERAAYALLDKLLAARSAAGANRSLAWLPFRLLPADAALVAVTPLHSIHVVEALVDLRRRGRRVAALVVETTDLLPSDPSLDIARRFWTLELDRRVRVLHRAGIVASRWQAGAPLPEAIALLVRAAGRPVVRPAALHGVSGR